MFAEEIGICIQETNSCRHYREYVIISAQSNAVITVVQLQEVGVERSMVSTKTTVETWFMNLHKANFFQGHFQTLKKPMKPLRELAWGRYK